MTLTHIPYQNLIWRSSEKGDNSTGSRVRDGLFRIACIVEMLDLLTRGGFVLAGTVAVEHRGHERDGERASKDRSGHQEGEIVGFEPEGAEARERPEDERHAENAAHRQNEEADHPGDLTR